MSTITYAKNYLFRNCLATRPRLSDHIVRNVFTLLFFPEKRVLTYFILSTFFEIILTQLKCMLFEDYLL